MPERSFMLRFRAVGGLWLGLAFLPSAASAGDLEITSVGEPVVVMRGRDVVGTTPVTLTSLPAGSYDLGFRETLLGATLFTESVDVSEPGAVRLEVNLPERTAALLDANAPRAGSQPAKAQAAYPATEPAPLAELAEPTPTVKHATGELYVSTTPPGAAVYVDGNRMEGETPTVLRGLDVGKHTVEARTSCARASATATVAEALIARVELVPVEGRSTIVVSAGPGGTRVLLDGADVGKAPITLKNLACGDHTLALRAPGYLEASRELRTRGYETFAIDPVTAVPTTPAPKADVKDRRSGWILLEKEEFGTLVVDVLPLEVAVTVDGIAVGAGPRSLEKIAKGTHEVAGTLEGFEPQTVEVTIEANAVARSNLSLRPITLVAEAVGTARTNKKKGEGGPAARIALNSAVSAVGLGGIVVGGLQLLSAQEAYNRYTTVATDEEAAVIFTNEVEPLRTQGWVFGGAGLAVLGGSAALWLTTDF